MEIAMETDGSIRVLEGSRVSLFLGAVRVLQYLRLTLMEGEGLF